MPVDPGNLICLGRIGERPALVLPGCARSPKLNGIDWVLSRLFAGLDVTGLDIAGMGLGRAAEGLRRAPDAAGQSRHCNAACRRIRSGWHRPGGWAVQPDGAA